MLFIDIETAPLPVAMREAHRPTLATLKAGNTKDPDKLAAKVAEAVADFEAGADAGIDPLQCYIAIIGFARNNEPVQRFFALTHEQEAEALRGWWTVAQAAYGGDLVCGHNIRFDAAMLIHRSWLTGVAVPPRYLEDIFRFQQDIWLDTMRYWQLGDRQARYQSLATLCRAFNIPAKTGGELTGATFHKYWPVEHKKCFEYNAGDVESVRALAIRLGLATKFAT